MPALLVTLAACGSSATPAASPTTAARTATTVAAAPSSSPTTSATATASTTAAATTALATTVAPATTAPPTTAAATKRTYDVCAMLTAADVTAAGGSGEGRAKGSEKPDHITSTCTWGGYPTQPGLFVSIGSYQDRAGVDAVEAQLSAVTGATPVGGVGDAAVREGDGITAFKGTVVFGVYSSGLPAGGGASDAALLAALKIIETKI